MEQKKIDATVKVATAIGRYLATVQDEYLVDRNIPLNYLCKLKNELNKESVENTLNEEILRCGLGNLLLKTRAACRFSGSNMANEALRIYTPEEQASAFNEMIVEGRKDMDTLFPVPWEERGEFLGHFFVALKKAWGRG